MNYAQGKRILDEKNFLISGTKLPYSWKKVRSINFNYESFEKFISKAVLLHLILKKNEKKFPNGGLTEYEFPNSKKINVLKIDGETEEFTGYKIETGKDKKGATIKQVPVVTIDLNKAPQQIHDAFKTLKDYFSIFID